MTEAEWLKSTNALHLIRWIEREGVSIRKLRLFLVQILRDMAPLMSHAACVLSESVQESLQGAKNAEAIRQHWVAVHREPMILHLDERIGESVEHSWKEPWYAIVLYHATRGRRYSPSRAYSFALVELGARVSDRTISDPPRSCYLRDIFGNPFRPVAFDSRWRTSNTLAIATQMYESRAFSLMPMFADALEEAGCEHADILAHCRGVGPHVRGCWVVDLVLGKS